MDFVSRIMSQQGRRIVAFLNQLSFVLANVILYVIFSKYTSANIVSFMLISLIGFILIGKIQQITPFTWLTVLAAVLFWSNSLGKIIGLVILGLFAVIMLIQFAKADNGDDKGGVTWIMFWKIFVVFPKLLFFSISYVLFPLLFVWIASLGVATLLGWASIKGDTTLLLNVLTILGLIFGFFQFYLQRYEDKVQSKITQHFAATMINRTKLMFSSFRKFVEEHQQYKDVEKKIETLIDKGGFKYLSDSTSRRNQGRSLTQYFISVQKSAGPLIEFTILEADYRERKKMKDLSKAYAEFFEEKKKAIIEDLDLKQLRELGWSLLSNINILEESYTTIVSFKPEEDDPETYQDFLLKTEYELINYAMNHIIFK